MKKNRYRALLAQKKYLFAGLAVLLLAALAIWVLYGRGPLKLGHTRGNLKDKPVFLDEMKFNKRYPLSVLVDGKRLYMTFFHEENISVFSLNGWRKGAIKAKTRGEKGFPHGVAAFPEKLVVTDTVNGTIGFISREGKALDAFWETPDKQALKPVGAAVYKNIVYITDANLRAWLAIDNKGELINIVRGQTAESTMYHPWGIAISSDGRAFIADYKGSRVKVFNCAGWYAYDFETGRGEEILNSPQGIAIDGLGRVHVVDKVRNKIFVFSNVGKFMFTYGQDLQGPSGVAVDKKNRVIYVTNSEAQGLQVYGY